MGLKIQMMLNISHQIFNTQRVGGIFRSDPTPWPRVIVNLLQMCWEGQKQTFAFNIYRMSNLKYCENVVCCFQYINEYEKAFEGLEFSSFSIPL